MADEERRRKAKICAKGFALAYRNSSRNKPEPMEVEGTPHSAEHHHHSPELTQQTSVDCPPLVRRSSRRPANQSETPTRPVGRVSTTNMGEEQEREARERRRAEIARGKRAVIKEEEVQADNL